MILCFCLGIPAAVRQMSSCNCFYIFCNISSMCQPCSLFSHLENTAKKISVELRPGTVCTITYLIFSCGPHNSQISHRMEQGGFTEWETFVKHFMGDYFTLSDKGKITQENCFSGFLFHRCFTPSTLVECLVHTIIIVAK